MNFYNKKENIEMYGEMCKEYNNDFVISFIKKHLQKNKKILELGSGLGYDARSLMNDYEITVSDNSNLFIEKLKKIFKNKVIKINALSFKTNSKYDCIYSNKVLYHFKIDELLKSLECQFQSITNDGIIIFTLWLSSKTKEEYIKEYDMLSTTYNKDELMQLLSSKWKIVDFEVYQEEQFEDSIVIALKK